MGHRGSGRSIIPTTMAPSLSISMATILKSCAIAQSNRPDTRGSYSREMVAGISKETSVS